MHYTWTHDAGLWHLSIDDRRVYSVASNRRPTDIETFRIVRRLRRFYPALMRKAA